MKKRIVSALTLMIFAVGIFGGSAVAMATTTAPTAPEKPSTAPTATLTNHAIKNGKGVEVKIPDMMDLSVKVVNAEKSSVAYGYNATKAVPSTAAPVEGYVLAADQSKVTYVNHADKPRAESTLMDDVRNVIWNGYPYMGGTWKGVAGDPANYQKEYGMTDQARLTALYNMQVTQQAVWFYTDSKAPTGPLAADINKLIEAAKLNPAPVNFKLDFYDATNAKVQNGTKMQHVLALVNDEKAAKNIVDVKIDDKWLEKDEKTEYTGTRPSASYELYEGDITEGEKPLHTYQMPADTSSLSIPLIDDNQRYTVREVLGEGSADFTVLNDQVVDLSKNTGAAIPLTFTHIHKGSVNEPTPQGEATTVSLTAEATLDGKIPPDGTFSLLLKDSNGNILQTRSNKGKIVAFDPLKFDKEGSYVYTLTELTGDNKNLNYDAASYEMTVTVSKDKLLKADVNWKKSGAVYSGLVPVFANTTKAAAQTTTLTVHKVWKNDKVATRPNSVNVQLYRNGSAYGAMVRLDSSNGWVYTWKDLDSAYKWTVNEPTVPAGYTKSLQTTGTTWTITNTGKSTPTITTPVTTNKNDKGTPKTDDISHLNLWITGATISLSGMCLIVLLGILNRRKQQDKK